MDKLADFLYIHHPLVVYSYSVQLEYVLRLLSTDQNDTVLECSGKVCPRPASAHYPVVERQGAIES